MSEVTTGSGAISVIGAPIAAGAACMNAVESATKYCNDKYEDMLKDVQETNERLKWLDKQQCSSPEQIAKEIRSLQQMLLKDKKFLEMINELSTPEKNVMATAIAAENSLLKSHLPI